MNLLGNCIYTVYFSEPKKSASANVDTFINEYAVPEMVLSITVDTISQKIYKPASIYYSTYSLR